MVARILLVRHGETDWNALGKLQGHTDVPLNSTGQGQARVLAERLRTAGVRAVVASDLSRAKETAALIASCLGALPVETDPDLRERRFGIFEGLTRDECMTQHPEAWKAWLDRAAAPNGGEEREIVVGRMMRALERAKAKAHAPPEGGVVLVVSHGGIMRLWLNEVTSTRVPLIGNGAAYAVDFDEHGVRAALWSG